MSSQIIVSFDIGVKNLAVCVIEYNPSDLNILVWKIISLAAPKEKIPIMNELAGRLFLELDTLVDEIGQPIDFVILENQPSNLNGSMKSLQMMIYTYFQLRKHWEGLSKQVYLVSASEKLKGHETITDTLDMTKYETMKRYEKNKKLGVEITKMYLSKNPEILNYFCSYKKADDMADSFLQAISWLKKHNVSIENISMSSKTI